MTGTARIAVATAADVAALCALDVSLVKRDRQDAIVRESVRDGTAFAAWDADALAGYVTWDLGFFHRPFVRLLAVARTHRRRGIGAALLRRVEEAAFETARVHELRPELFVTTEGINADMQALLARAGYAPSGSIDNVNEPGNPELVYHRLLREEFGLGAEVTALAAWECDGCASAPRRSSPSVATASSRWRATGK